MKMKINFENENQNCFPCSEPNFVRPNVSFENNFVGQKIILDIRVMGAANPTTWVVTRFRVLSLVFR
jgi:hypothetical protein